MTSLLWLALTTFVVVQSNVLLRDRNAESWDEQDRQMMRGIRAADDTIDKWVTEDQKKILEPLRKDPKAFHDKIMEFYNQLSPENSNYWDKKYRKECLEWVKEAVSVEAEGNLADLFRQDKEEAVKKWDEYSGKLSAEHREKVNIWKKECQELLTTNYRSRRNLDSNFADFTKWMTDDQKKELEELKSSGKSLTELRAKSIEFFDALPADKQATLKEEYKGKCKAYFKTIATEDEMKEIKSLYNSGSKGEIASKVAAIVDRQSDDVKSVATKMQSVCTDVYAEAKKFRRDINQKIDQHMNWLTDEQKQSVREMYAAGKSKEEIKATILTWLSNLEGTAKADAKENLRKECYKWLESAASQAERDELHKLHETDHGACKTKVREYIKRLDTQTRAEVEKNLPFCEKVWYGDHDAHAHHGHHHRKRRHLHAIDKYIDWLSPEQKTEVEDLEESGADFPVVLAKVKEFYLAESDEKKEELKSKFKEQCASWVNEVATPEELAQLREQKEAENFSEVRNLLSQLESRLDEEKKHTVEHVRDVCMKVWDVPVTRKRREHSHDDAFEKYLSWTSESQKVDLKQIKEGGDREAFYKKVMEFFGETTGEARTTAVEELKSACKHFAHDIFGEEKLATIAKMKEAGSSHEKIGNKLTEFANGLEDEVKQKQALGLVEGCKKVYTAAATRKRREQHSLSDAFGKYLTWTTDDQKKSLKELEEAGNKAEIYKKVLEYFDATTGDTRKTAAEQLKGACKHYGIDLFGEEKVASLKELKESGASNEELKKKIMSLIEEITDEVKKGKASKLVEGCERVYAAASRKRRDHERKLDEAFTSYLAWTTEEQRTALKALEENKEELYKKMMDFYEETTGETRTKATEQLKSGCKHFSIEIFGVDKVATLTELQDSGATPEQMKAKVMEFVGELTDEKKKEKANMLVKGCEKLYGVASRKRRDHEHTLEDALEKYLTWTTEDQQMELKNLKDEGKKEEIYGKIMTYFEATAGDTRKKAVEELKAACKHYATDLFGEEKVATLKTLKESGTSVEAMQKKVLEFVREITDEDKKAKATKLAGGCGKVYAAAASRRRRDHHHTTLEDALPKYLTWLTEDQKNELKSLKDAGKKDEIYGKVLEFFEAATGDAKKTGIEQLKTACKSYAKELFGEAKFETLKAAKDSGASEDDMKKKVQELVGEITDEAKKVKATKLTEGCEKVYTAAASRKRRDQQTPTLEDALMTYLTWLNDDQKKELKDLYDSGKKEVCYDKVLEYFDAATGSTKKTAIEELKGVCKKYGKEMFGEAKFETLKTLKESGASLEDVKKKVNELIDEINDATKKAAATKLSAACEKVYAASLASRRRRAHHFHHSFEDNLNKFLGWLTEDQRDELKSLKQADMKEDIYVKIVEYFQETTREARSEALSQLTTACNVYAKDLFGEAHYSDLDGMQKAGATKAEFKMKVNEIVRNMGHGERQDKSFRLAIVCSEVSNVHKNTRHRRDHHEHTLEDAFPKYLSWLTDDQKNELKALKKAGKKEEIYGKILEFFEATSGDTKKVAIEELRGACKHYAIDLFGETKFASLKELKESGASVDDIKKRVMELAEEITDSEKKEKVQQLVTGCGKVYAVADTTFEDALKYLTWLTEDQKNELKVLKEFGKKKEMLGKVVEFFDAATGDAKRTAVQDLMSACKHYAKELFGEEKVATLKSLKESGTSVADMQKKVLEFVGEITDENKKAKATRLAGGCGKVYAAAASRKRRDHHHTTLEDALPKYLSWLTEDQKNELKALKEAGKKEEIYGKVLEFFEAATGDAKKTGIEQLKSACKHYAKDLFGEEKVATLKSLKESGTSVEEIHKKVLEFVGEITDDEKKAKATKLAGGCGKVYAAAAASRKRRDHHHTTLEDALSKYLTWLTEDQKNELKSLKDAGKKDEIYGKVLEFFEAATGDAKKSGIEELKSACKSYAKDVFGEAKFETLKVAKESGASADDMKKKVLEFVGEIADETKKAKAAKLAEGCGKVYAAAAASRKRRDHHEHTLDDAFTKYLTWLTEDQKNELKSLKEAGKKEEIYKKIMDFFDDAQGESKTTAVAQMKAGCKHYSVDIFGQGKFDEIKSLKESGASVADITDKLNSFIGSLPDGDQDKAKGLVANCKRVFEAGQPATRVRRMEMMDDLF